MQFLLNIAIGKIKKRSIYKNYIGIRNRVQIGKREEVILESPLDLKLTYKEC